MTVSCFPKHFLLEAIGNYQFFPLLAAGLFRQVLESIHKIYRGNPCPAYLRGGLIKIIGGVRLF